MRHGLSGLTDPVPSKGKDVMPAVLDLATYRGETMPISAKRRKQEAATEKVPALRAANHTIRMSDETWDNWRLWCKVNKLTYEESMIFFLEHHPIDVEKLREAYRYVR